MICPACAGQNFQWAKQCDHCRAPLTGARPAATIRPAAGKPPAPAGETPIGSTSVCAAEPLDQAGRDARVQAITDRMQAILASGQKPEWIFIGQTPNGGFLCLPPQQQRTSLLLFTSPVLVTDYFRAIGQQGQPAGIRFDSITELPKGWPELGVHSFCLNRCPRCNVVLAFPLDGMSSLESFRKIWALERASRFLRGQQLAKSATDSRSQGMVQMKEALEVLRDHVAADNAHVHQLLAIIALTQQDADGRATALARLAEFQLPGKLETDDVPRGFAEGLVGLLATFELLKLPGVVRP